MADVYGICYVCRKIAGRTCKLCGRPVCDEHYDSVLGICVVCKSGRSFKSRSRKAKKYMT